MIERDVSIIDIVLLNEYHIDELVKLENKCFSDPWTVSMFLGDLKSEHTYYFGAYNKNNELIGYIGMWNVGDASEITNIAVHPDYRRKGIATELVNELETLCLDIDILYINLEVRESNCKAISLYDKLGFEKVGLRKNYYKNPTENAILMTKNLNERID